MEETFVNISQFCRYSISFSIKFWCMAFLGTAILSNTRKFSSSKVSCYAVLAWLLGFAVRVPIAACKLHEAILSQSLATNMHNLLYVYLVYNRVCNSHMVSILPIWIG